MVNARREWYENEKASVETKNLRKYEECKSFGKIIMPLLMMIFNVCYWFYALYYYFFSEEN